MMIRISYDLDVNRMLWRAFTAGANWARKREDPARSIEEPNYSIERNRVAEEYAQITFRKIVQNPTSSGIVE